MALGLALAACAGQRMRAEAISRYQGVGRASWYGAELAGHRTASGARFDPNAFTAAHRTLPFGTLVDVTSLENGRRVRVTINDRGPSDRSRIIDLSRAAARALGPDRALARVRLRVIAPGAQHIPLHETRAPLEGAERDEGRGVGYPSPSSSPVPH